MGLANVDQIAVVGYPDVRLSEVPVAFIVPQTGHTVSLKQVNAHCKGKIASYKIPRFVVNLDILPMTPTGKIQKHKLRTLALEELPKNSMHVGSNGLHG